MNAWLVWLGGCSFGLTEAAPDTEDKAPRLVIREIDPRWGPTTGGTPVTVTGEGFEGEVAVEFGGIGLQNVTVVNDSTLVFETPRVNQEVSVDVRVTSDLGTDVVAGGFTYEESSTGDTGDTQDTGDTGDTQDSGDSGDTGDTGTAEELGGYVELGFLLVSCAECFGEDSELVISARAAFHAPTSTGWLDWLPAAGACVADPYTGPPTTETYDVGDVILTSDVSSFTLEPSQGAGGVVYEDEDLGAEAYPPGATFDMGAEGGPDASAFSAADMVVLPGNLGALEPVAILNSDLGAAWSATIDRAGQTFTWSASGDNGLVVVRMDVYGTDARSFVGTLVCVESDTGTLTLPASYLSDYPSGARAAVTVSRYHTSTFTLPGGGTGEILASTGVKGTAVLN